MIKIFLFGILSKRARAFVMVWYARHGVGLNFMGMDGMEDKAGQEI